MKKCINLLLTALVCIFLVLSTTGCWNRHELNKLAILMGIGLDKPADATKKIQLTAQIVKTGELKSSKNGGGSGSGKSYWNIESTGDTVFDALRNFTHESSRKVYMPHNQIIIIGRGIAQEGVQKYIDFFVRDHESRLNVWVLVSKATAKEVLDIKAELEKIPALDISDLVKIQAATSQTSTVKLKDFLARLLSKTTAPIAPIVEVSVEGGKKVVHISGTAVFKRDKLVGQLDKTETRGLLWAIDEVKSGIIKVRCPGTSDKVSLEIIKAKGKIIPEIRDNKIHMKIEIKEEGNIGDQSCLENLAIPTKIAALEKEKAIAIRGEVLAALNKARDLHADIFGFGETIHQKYPKQWKELEGRWEEAFSDIETEVLVEARLELTGQITKPIDPEQE